MSRFHPAGDAPATSRAEIDERSAIRSRVWLALWLLALGCTAIVLPGVSSLVSPPPLLEGLDATRDWFQRRDAADIVTGCLRLLVTVAAWYLLASTVLGSALRLLAGRRGTSVQRAAELLLLPPCRRLVSAALGAGLSAAALGSVASASSPDSHGPAQGDGRAAVMRRLPVDEVPVLMQRVPDGAATMVRLPEEAGPATAPETWTVGPGDHLWSIAEQVLAERLGRAPTDAEIDPFWRALVDENRADLADPANPDLVFPGQQMDLPSLG